MQLSVSARLISSSFRPEFIYEPTILSSTSLCNRLSIELRFLLTTFRSNWSVFKEDPFAFVWGTTTESLRRRPSNRRLATTMMAALLVSSAVLFVIINDNGDRSNGAAASASIDQTVAEILNLSPENAPVNSASGIGAGSVGRVGLRHGRGEGSHPEKKRSGGGGSGGDKQKLAVSKGAVPPPSEIPAPIPTAEVRRNPSLPVAGIDIDPALWRAIPAPAYGDPRSSASTPSNGPGTNGGIGTEDGQGIGDGRGNGFGRGWDGNIGDGPRQRGGLGPGGGEGNDPNGPESILKASMVSQRARVLSKPEPQYTEEARRNQITGTVVLRAVFSKTGDVTNIRAVSSLPFGLTERAIAAARQIRFLPAMKDNHPVSVHMQLEYNFNLY
jgi:TonB family protein